MSEQEFFSLLRQVSTYKGFIDANAFVHEINASYKIVKDKSLNMTQERLVRRFASQELGK